jgi:hypothetical protein
LRTGSNLQGLGDRINAVASIGVAMVLVGIVAALAQVRPAVALAAGALLLVAAVPVANRQSSAAKWASTQVIVAAESPTLYVNPSKGSRDGITGAEGSWTVSAARELLRNNSNAIACVPPRGPHGSPGNDATYSLAQCGKDAPGGPPPT